MPRRVIPTLPLARPVAVVPAGSLATLRRNARACRACPLWKPATQTVFGEGPATAAAMLLGEQPGNAEDLSGRPFVGPAGALLDAALAEAGLARDALYLTNTVKHFKFEPRGKVRLHKRATAAEQAACRPWLAGELARLQPRWIVCLGAMAAQAVFGAGFRITRERGRWIELDGDRRGLATWHPAAVLRARDEDRARMRSELVADLAQLAAAMSG